MLPWSTAQSKEHNCLKTENKGRRAPCYFTHEMTLFEPYRFREEGEEIEEKRRRRRREGAGEKEEKRKRQREERRDRGKERRACLA